MVQLEGKAITLDVIVEALLIWRNTAQALRLCRCGTRRRPDLILVVAKLRILVPGTSIPGSSLVFHDQGSALEHFECPIVAISFTTNPFVLGKSKTETSTKSMWPMLRSFKGGLRNKESCTMPFLLGTQYIYTLLLCLLHSEKTDEI